MNLSASLINSYLNCPLSYKLRYVLNIRSPIRSEVMEFGSKVHAKIAKRDFESKDEKELKMLLTAKEILSTMPEDEIILEGDYSQGKLNPGKIYGTILDRDAVAILDLHCPPETAIIRDWKTGKWHSEKYSEQYEIQGYFCSELFQQKYDFPVNKMYFDFLPSVYTYEAKVVKDSRARSKIEHKIKNTLQNIEKENFKPKRSKLCDYCEYSCLCCDESLLEL
jgi:CRISPR/Cas system-associated exonuclease Cas4 (RecB family)